MQELGGLEPAMPGEDNAVLVDDDKAQEPVSQNAVRDLANLLLGVFPSVPDINPKRFRWAAILLLFRPGLVWRATQIHHEDDLVLFNHFVHSDLRTYVRPALFVRRWRLL